MPKNEYLIPKENLAQVEEIREIEEKDLIMSEQQAKVIDYFKERQNLIKNKSKLSPAARIKVIKKYGDDYLSERAFDHDIALMKMYGPGFWSEVGGFVVKTVAATATAGVVVATAGTAAPLVGAGMWLGGKAVEEIGKEADIQALRSIGSFTKDAGLGSVTGFMSTAEGVTKLSVKFGWEAAKIERFNRLVAIKGYVEAGKYVAEHDRHRSNGINYDRNCELCNL
jgi:hypothetical protein